LISMDSTGAPRPSPAAPRPVLDAFWKLSNAKEGLRLEAAGKILSHVQDEPASSGSLSSYVLSRLVRGLSSDREEARKGFYSALVGFFKVKGDAGVMREARELANKYLTGRGESKSVSYHHP